MKKRNRIFWVMDYETIVNCFVAVFTSYSSNETHTFIVNRETNDFEKFIQFLEENIDCNDWHFGYNNLAFDAQITEFCLENKEEMLWMTSDEISATRFGEISPLWQIKQRRMVRLSRI